MKDFIEWGFSTLGKCRSTMLIKQGAIFSSVMLASALLLRPAGAAAQGSSDSSPTPAQVQALFSRAIENQHHNEEVLEEFERVERVVTRNEGDSTAVASDHTSRVIPTGTGIIRIDVPMDHSPASMAAYRRDLRQAIAADQLAIHPNDREKQDSAKFEKRRRDRAELLDDAGKAFHAKWAGRETRDSRTLAKFLLQPNPEYHPATRFGAIFQHVHATIWIDEGESQMARLEADIDSDISFGGGILGKVYRGGHIVMEQQEVQPGMWEPALLTYDVDGRKFIVGFAIHDRTEISGYRRLGQPAQAIEIIQKELNSLEASSDPH